MKLIILLTIFCGVFLPNVYCTNEALLKIIDSLYQITNNQHSQQTSNNVTANLSFVCGACHTLINTLKSLTASEPLLKFAVSATCTTFKFGKESTCNGYANLFVPHISFILKNSNLTTQQMCGVALGKKCLTSPPSVFETWTVPLPEAKKATHANFSVDMSALKILHLSDFHFDPLYKEGSLTNCDQSLCCRESSVNGNGSAGYWGHSSNCDAPLHLLKNLVRHLNKTHENDFDLLFWTGDNSPHDSWMTTADSIVYTSTTITKLLKKHLSKNKIVFPILGNHEGMPSNQFAISNDTQFYTQWIYEQLAKQWSEWLETKEAINTFKIGGYYAKKFGKNCKAIALNTNICDRINFWNLYAPIDPHNQLHWMVKELQKSEENGENVYILGHIAPDSMCTQIWFHNFLRITERYRDTIKGFFYGHTHRDEFKLYYSPKNKSDLLHVGYIGPSVTSFNPGFRFYSLDTNGNVENIQSYYLNLTEANKKGKQATLKWRKLYEAKQDYGLKSLSPQEWNSFYNRLLTNDTLTQIYYGNVIRHSDAFPKYCDEMCKKLLLLGPIPQKDVFE